MSNKFKSHILPRVMKALGYLHASSGYPKSKPLAGKAQLRDWDYKINQLSSGLHSPNREVTKEK